MQVVCTDGTVFHCESYEVIDGGVKLFGKNVHDDGDPGDRYEPETDDVQVGYVPDDKLAYVLPDEAVPRHTPPVRNGPTAGAPPDAARTRPPGNPPR